jgi:hypothetical protein
MKSDMPGEFQTYDRLPLSHKNKHEFHLFKGYDANDDGLSDYSANFKTWCMELKKNPIMKIDYSFYYNHHIAVESIFKKLCENNKTIGAYTDYNLEQDVSKLEAQYMALCYNGGLTYCDTYEGPCYGYDFNSYYPRLLASRVFKIPVSQGTECYVDVDSILESGQKLKYGMYYVQITSFNPNAKKTFAFSKNSVYTHYSIEFAYQHRELLGFEFAYYDEADGYNAYIYEDNTLIQGEAIFGNWLHTLTDIRVLYPKNKLIKHLLSSLWGTLCRNNTLHKTYEEIIEEKLDVGGDECHYRIHNHVINDKSDYYILHNNVEPYHHALARIKPFLVSYARNRIATVAMKDLDAVVRIHTDSACFKTEQTMFPTRHIYLEDKTTGNLRWSGIVNKKPERI